MQRHFILLFVVTFSLFIINAKAQTSNECATFLNNTEVAWLSVFAGHAEAGSAIYYSNGTFATYISGFLVATGLYTVEDGGNGWCYEYETYNNSGGPPTCNTFSICPETNSMIGCEVIGKSCLKSCETELQWTNWYSARINGTAND